MFNLHNLYKSLTLFIRFNIDWVETWPKQSVKPKEFNTTAEDIIKLKEENFCDTKNLREKFKSYVDNIAKNNKEDWNKVNSWEKILSSKDLKWKDKEAINIIVSYINEHQKIEKNKQKLIYSLNLEIWELVSDFKYKIDFILKVNEECRVELKDLNSDVKKNLKEREKDTVSESRESKNWKFITIRWLKVPNGNWVDWVKKKKGEVLTEDDQLRIFESARKKPNVMWAIEKYFPKPEEFSKAILVASFESSFNPKVKDNINRNGSKDRWLFQINSCHKSECDWEKLYDPLKNTQFARKLFDWRNWSWLDWSVARDMWLTKWEVSKNKLRKKRKRKKRKLNLKNL